MGKVIYIGMNIGDEEINLGLATPYGEQGAEIPPVDWFLGKYGDVDAWQ